MPEVETVLTIGRLHPRVIDRLSGIVRLVPIPGNDPFALDAAIRLNARALIDFAAVPESLVAALPSLRMISHFGVGYDGVDCSACAARGIRVTNTPDVLNDEVADTALGLLLNTVRDLSRAENWLRAGRWSKDGPYPLTPLSLKGRSAGIYGLGRIGLGIARRLEAFGLSVAYHSRRPRSDVAYAYHPTLESLAEACDTLIAIVPKTPQTYRTINAEILRRLGPDGVFINVGRGWTVDEKALSAALHGGVIAAAGLDVFDNEPHVAPFLIDTPRLTLLPHVASASVPTRNAMADLVVDNLLAFLEGRPLLTPVAETPDR